MKINIWSDYACPFCWIGEVRLRKALNELALLDKATLVPRAFELNPDAPKATDLNGLGTIARRYGMSLTQAQAEFDKIAAMGRADGLVLNQVDTHHTNTFDSHRLMKLAQGTGDRLLEERLNEMLFSAFFVYNLNLADWDVLLKTGKEAGLSEKPILEMLESDQYATQVRADEEEAAQLGIHGVPYFIFDNGTTASGALPLEEFKRILLNTYETEHTGKFDQCSSAGCKIK